MKDELDYLKATKKNQILAVFESGRKEELTEEVLQKFLEDNQEHFQKGRLKYWLNHYLDKL